MQKNKGFTIIELVVVIAIIAILSSIVLINVGGYINKAKYAAAVADLKTLEPAAGSYLTAGGGFIFATQQKLLLPPQQSINYITVMIV